MNRISRTLDALKKDGRKGLVGYLTAGDPDAATSERNIRAGIAAGIDILELGIPFSDPTADGPVIQEAAGRALAAGMSVKGGLEMVRRLRKDLDTPIILFGYINPFFRYGYAKLAADAAETGVDGLLVVDLPFEERRELQSHTDRYGISLIPLIAPTTPPERAAMILKDATGFVYYIMVTGVTGAREQAATNVTGHVQALRACSNLPIAVGFGVSNGSQARVAAEYADAVVVGSALVKAATTGTLVTVVRDIRSGLDSQ
jgi:tryptophan synthase alpha chain